MFHDFMFIVLVLITIEYSTKCLNRGTNVPTMINYGLQIALYLKS